MPYSQKPLIRLMEQGLFPRETSKPKHIETVISNVFIFRNKVYKIYKNDNKFFNKKIRNISDKSARFFFTKRDFQWNHVLSPSIYISAIGVRVQSNKIRKASGKKAQELVIVMRRMDNKNVLFEKLTAGRISKRDCFLIGKQLAYNLKKVQKKLPKKYNYYKVFKFLINEAFNWAKVATPKYIGIKELGRYIAFLEQFRKENKNIFENTLSKELTCIGDIHSHNALFSKKRLQLIDTFPPRESWFVGHAVIPAYRLATDIWALTGKREFFKEFIKGFEAGNKLKIDRSLDSLYIMYSSVIMISYLYMLQETDASKRKAARMFHGFVRDYFSNLCSVRGNGKIN